MQDNCQDRPELKNIDYIYKRNLQIKELKKQRINDDDDWIQILMLFQSRIIIYYLFIIHVINKYLLDDS